MFTWICPKCGTEVPPSHSECPTCVLRERQAGGVAAAAAPAAPMPVPVATPAPVAAPVAPPVAAPIPMPVAYPNVPPPQPEAVPPPEMRRPPKPAGVLFGGEADSSAPMAPPYANAPYVAGPAPAGGMPSWLIAVLSLIGVGVVCYGAYAFLTRGSSPSTATKKGASEVQISQTESRNPVAKFVEVVGFRIVEDRGKATLKFLVVNHSSGEIGGFDLEVKIRTKNAKPEEAPLFTVKAPIRSIGPWESKDFTVPASTALRAYELPDWQFLSATFDIIGGQ